MKYDKTHYFIYGHSCFFSIFTNNKGKKLKGWQAEAAWWGYCCRHIALEKALKLV